jgi:hypothetical protein
MRERDGRVQLGARHAVHDNLSATRTRGSAPGRAAMPSHERRRAALTATVTRPAVFAPAAAISLSVRRTASTDATGCLVSARQDPAEGNRLATARSERR